MKFNIAPLRLTLLTLASFCMAPLSFAANTVIDVMVVYTPGVTSTYGGDPTTRINQLMAFTNQVYVDSGVNLEVHLVKAVELNFPDTGTDNVALAAIKDGTSTLSTVAALRDQFKADMVVFYRKYDASHNYCGLAYVGGYGSLTGDVSGYKSLMFGTMSINTCPDYVTSHELGHNMGLRHSRKQDTTGGAFPYALGHGVDGQFTTVMAYESEFSDPSGAKKVYKFSSPSITCSGQPCGVIKTDSTNGADAVYALSVTTPQIAEFYAGSAAVGAKTTLEQLNDTVQTTKIAWDAAIAALAANKAAITTKTTAQTAAKTALTVATTAAKNAQKQYDTALKTYNKSAANVTALAAKTATALANYNSSTTDALRIKNLTLYNTLNASYAAAVTQKAAYLAASEALVAPIATATEALTTATTNYTAAVAALNAEKAAKAGLTAAVNSTKAANTAAVKAYAAEVKKSAGKK